MAKPKRKQKTVYSQIRIEPTPERKAKAEGFIFQGQNGTITVRDSPLERLASTKPDPVISQREYDAGVKFRHHWHRGGLGERFAVQNFMGVGGDSATDLLPATEAQIHHRQQYRRSVKALGMRLSMVVEGIVCREWTLAETGRKLGYENDPQARAAATEALRNGLEILMREYGG